ncbi:scavenger receptor cysteine-rich domain-containing protein DMBT1-like [Haliotis cracherodii]|uniref:scavenger receptor cysteine-rich domain-containing protein DMBT1-like n=1 Tax=Haliotis cracherodii TaxID=6455 RepID=UPI0039E90E5E
MKTFYLGVATVLAGLCLVLVCDAEPDSRLNWLRISSWRNKRQASTDPTPVTAHQASTSYNPWMMWATTTPSYNNTYPTATTGSAHRGSTPYNPWLNWTTTTPSYNSTTSSNSSSCSQTLSGTEGSFSSPGAEVGASYSDNLDCLYTIPSPPPGSLIDITFMLFQLEDHSSCNYDYVQFSYTRQKICGIRTTPLSFSFTSQDTDFKIYFHSDGSVHHPGFIAAFRIRENPTPTTGSSYRTSTSYNPWLNRTSTTPWYYRTTTSNNPTPTTGSSYRTSTSYNPWLNRTSTTPWYYRTTTSNNPTPTTGSSYRTSTSYNPWLNRTATTPWYYRTTTFFISCNLTYTADEGTIESTPGDGSYYPNNAYCTYTVQGNSSLQTLQLTVQTFSLEAQSSCRYDSLQFGSTSSRKYCGSSLYAGRILTYSFTNTFTLYFKTDYSVTRRGFSINYRTVPYVPTISTTTTTTTAPPTPNCNETFTASNGQLRSPNSPYHYPNNIYCRYTFVGSGQTQSITLDFTSFDLENHASCRWDWVIISGGNKRCGFTEFSSTYTFVGNFTVEFRTDGSVTYSGFVANYVVSDAVNATTPTPGSTATCTATLSSLSGSIMSAPGDGSNYLDNTRCYYTFTATSYPRTITFTFTTFQLESHPSCGYDYLQFNSGVKKCGTISYLVYTDTMNGQYRVTFYTDSSVTRRGFVATYQISDVIDAATTTLPTGVLSNNGPCGTTLTSSTGRIYYPTTANYTNNVQCQVTIRPGAGQTFNVTFTDFDLEYHSTCYYDSLEFQMYGVTSTKNCGRNRAGLTLSFPYTSGDIVMYFRSDGSVTGRGFDLNYQVI